MTETSPPLTWRAVYADGSILNQYNCDGTKNVYNDIPREGLTQFMLLTVSDTPLILVHLDENKRLIWRMRVAKRVMTGVQERVHLVGWQENRRGVNVQLVCAVFSDGHVEVVDRFKTDHPWFYPVQFREAERT